MHFPCGVSEQHGSRCKSGFSQAPTLEECKTSSLRANPSHLPCGVAFLLADFNTDFLSYSPQSRITLQSVVYWRDACLLSSFALPVLNRIPRPKDCPGVQIVTNASWCDTISLQCWYNVTYHQDFCTTASIPSSPQLDDQGGYEGAARSFVRF